MAEEWLLSDVVDIGCRRMKAWLDSLHEWKTLYWVSYRYITCSGISLLTTHLLVGLGPLIFSFWILPFIRYIFVTLNTDSGYYKKVGNFYTLHAMKSFLPNGINLILIILFSLASSFRRPSIAGETTSKSGFVSRETLLQKRWALWPGHQMHQQYELCAVPLVEWIENLSISCVQKIIWI